jgi:hypothetical protein
MMKRGLVLVEGQTEEQFVKHVLQPYLGSRTSLWLMPTILVTKVVKAGASFKGGIRSYAQAQRDIHKLLLDTNAAVITTLIDYYGLPTDFPGMATRPGGPPRQRVAHVQHALGTAINDARFVPFFMLHEFEALLFCDLGEPRAWVYEGADLAQLRAVRQAVTSPEDINDGYATAPSRRMLAASPGYQKTLHGPLAVMDIGIDHIRAQCPHFHAWLSRLEAV